MSRLPFELLLAFRYLRPKRTFISIITLIPVIGVMLGVAVLIVVISVMTGFDRELRNHILGFNAHLTVMKQGPMENYREVTAMLSANPNVVTVSPYVLGQVFVKAQPHEASLMSQRPFAPYVRGLQPHLETNSMFLTNILSGTNDLRGYGVLVGSNLARNMEIQEGDNLAIYSMRDLEKMETSMRRNREQGETQEVYLGTAYEVRGIFDVGYYEFDSAFLVCSLVNAQDMFGLEDSVEGLFVNLKAPERTRAVRAALEKELGFDYSVRTWEEDNSKLLDALIVEKNVMFYLLFFIMIVAAFCIMSALITFVMQKTREIGILKALGAASGAVMRIFLCQSLLVGIIGVLAGLGLGLLAVHYRNEFLEFMRSATGWELFPVEIYQFSQLPALVTPSDVTIICAGALLSCLIAGLLPAWVAGRLRPVQALRHE